MKKTLFVAVAILAIMFGVVGYASAATSASGTVTVNVTPNAKLEMVLTGATGPLTLSGVDPDAGSTSSTAGPTCTVKSNKAYAFNTSWSNGQFSDTYTHDATGHPESPTAGQAYNGNVTFTADGSTSWTNGTLTGIDTFTAVQ